MDEEHEPLTTKVYYYKDNEATPYVTEVPVPPSKITLYHFKDVLSHKHFKFYQKVLEPATGMEVKEEILDEDAPLKMSSNGRFELYLLTQVEQATLTRARENRGSFANFASRLDPHARSQRRQILSTPALYTRHQDRYDESSMDDTNFYPDSRMMKDSIVTEDESQVTDSEFTSVSMQYHKKHHHQRRQKRRRPLRNMSFMTDSTLTDISLSLDLITVSFHLNSPVPLGLFVRGERNSLGEDVGVYISRIEPNTLVALDGRIREGYMIVEVNDISLDNYSNDQAVDILRDKAKKSSILKLTVAQCEREPGTSFRLPNEPVRPIDTNMWVMHTNMMRGLMPAIPEGVENPSPAVRPTWPSSGIGSSVRSSSLCSTRLPHYQFDLNADLKSVVSAMADPINGIKSKVLMVDSSVAFRGEDMIEWLKSNVDGLSTIAQCEEYASKLLREGWIIQKVDTTSFTRECYYVFGHGVLGSIGAIQSTTTGQRGALKVIQNPHAMSELYSPVQHHCKKSCTLKKIFCIHPNSNELSKSQYDNKSNHVRSTHIP